MRTLPLLLAAALLAAPAAAQDDGTRRPPADTIRIGGAEAEGDSIRMVDEDREERDAAGPAVSAPGRYELASARGPFSVRSSGRTAPRPPRGEVVYADPSVPAAADTAPPARDTAAGDTVPRDTAPSVRDTAAAPTRPTPPPGSRVRMHTVERGETFYGIARRYGVAAAQLRALNPEVDPEVLEVGDRLQLPAAARDSRLPATPQPTARDRADEDDDALRTHTVVAGETLFGIARRYGVSAAEIVRLNRLASDQVRIGQRLAIPAAP